MSDKNGTGIWTEVNGVPRELTEEEAARLPRHSTESFERPIRGESIKRFFQLAAQSMELPEEQSMEIADLYPAWEPDKRYTVGTIVKYGLNQDGETQLYCVVQEHTSQSSWTPENTPSLFKGIGFTSAGVPIWTQPQGAHDAYANGDTVSHGGSIWVSDINGNVWEPGVYGWTVQS